MEKAILCIDDEAIILMSLKQELRRAFGSSFIYETARDGAEALEIMEGLSAEGIRLILVISDWLMPGIPADELIGRIRQTCTDIKIIIITGQANETRILQLQNEKIVNALIRKPWSHNTLVSTVQSCLEEIDEA